MLGDDLRCIDAHAHLGNWVFARAPEKAIVHYEIGLAIGELSLRSAPSDHLLMWGLLYNRPFLRCLNGYGLCLWRLGRRAEAERAFERAFALDPVDSQRVRFSWDAVRRGMTWEDFAEESGA